MVFTDIHSHVLFGTDDGAKNEEEMHAIVDGAYGSGTRVLCCTPHFHPGYFGDNRSQADSAYRKLREYVGLKYPDMSLYIGNELRYAPECTAWLQSGACRTLNGTRFVLVDFSEAAPEKLITDGLHRLLNAGYIPVLAHVERYRALHRRSAVIREYGSNGVILQADTQSLFRGFGLSVQHQCRRLLAEGLIDLFSSDTHDCTGRPPDMSACAAYLEKKFGAACAEALCCKNAVNILRGEAVRKDFS